MFGRFNLLRTATVGFAIAVSQPAAAAASETAILAGGCFWGVEGVFEHVKGVKSVVSGYAGGTRGGFGRRRERSGYAEAVKITFDPEQISYKQLLDLFFQVAHDPTQVDRQGPDVGPQYRSAIFPQNPAQKQIAQQAIAEVRARLGRPIATRLETGGFQLAEPAHQDYVRRNPTSRYVIQHDLPKLAKLRRDYPRYWRT